MSLILEALKKSEAERQLGRAPGLATPMPPVRRQRRSRWLPLTLVASALLVATAGAVWWMSRREAPQASAPASVPAGTPAPVPAVPPASSDAPPPAPAAARPAPTPAEVAPAAPAVPEFASVERESVAVVPAVPSAPMPEPARVPAPPAETVEPPPTPSATAASIAAASLPVPPSVPAQIPEPAAEPVEQLPRLDQLAGPRRDALPALKQTMHVFAEVPTDRFVLIDGARYREGDRLTNDLLLLEIRRDGSVFEYDGMRFLLPRP